MPSKLVSAEWASGRTVARHRDAWSVRWSASSPHALLFSAKSSQLSVNDRRVDAHPVTHVVGERLVQPEVVPPLHRDQVAEPLVGHLVRDHVGPVAALALGRLRPEHQLVGEGDTARVLHGAGVELGHERLVVVAERVADAEQPVVLVEALRRSA